MIKPRSEYHRNLLVNHKKKAMNKDKILMKIFQDWRKMRFYRIKGGWKDKTGNVGYVLTTRELWELYQQFLGKKPHKPG